MNTHPTRAWMFSLVLLSACGAGVAPAVVRDDEDIQSEGPTRPPAKGAETTSADLDEPARLDVAARTVAVEQPPETEQPPEAEQQEPTPAPPAKKTLGIVWQRQETGYWCGPGSTRIVISTRETSLPSQSSLAKQLGTTEDGTAYVGLMVNVLNDRWKLAGNAAYATRPMSDPPTAQQRAMLKGDLVARINAGYGIVANVVSGWRPPGYPSGTIYHYVAVVGYDDSGDKALVADPAGEASNGSAWSNVPRTYWITTEDLGTWIGGKGYTG